MQKVESRNGKIMVFFPRHDPHFWTHVAKIKKVTGRKFLKTPEPHWEVPATPWHAQQIIEHFGAWGIPPDVRSLADRSSQLAVVSRRRRSSQVYDQRLYPFQNAGIDFIREVGARAIIADDPGCGKTPQALVWLANTPSVLRTLIICPANVLYKWKHECSVWCPALPARVVETTKEPVDWAMTGIYIMTYAIMTRRCGELVSHPWDCLIMDEAHYIKEFRPTKGGKGSQRAIAAQRVGAVAKHILALDGTPFLNRPVELYPILRLLDPTAWENFSAFGFRYCGGLNGVSDQGFRGPFRGATNKRELAERLRLLMIRRTKTEVLDQLPALRRVLLPVAIDMKEYKAVRSAVVTALKRLDPKHKGYFANALDQLNALRRAVGVAKVPAAIAWATEFLEQTDPNVKLVIFCHHLDVVEGMKKGLLQFGVDIISGEVSPRRRSEIVSAFQKERLPRVLIITTAGGEGINLFGVGSVDASRILFVERDWTPAREEQAEARLHRIGQHSPVEAYYLVAKNTVDEVMAQAIDAKRADFRDVLKQEVVQTSVVKSVLTSLGFGS